MPANAVERWGGFVRMVSVITAISWTKVTRGGHMTKPLDEGGVASAERVSDEELTALALAADPKAPLNPDAVPWRAGMLQKGCLLYTSRCV